MNAERVCPLIEDGEWHEVPARCMPCVRSALRLPGTTVAVEYNEYDQEKYPYYAEDRVEERITVVGERRRHRRESQVINPDTNELIQTESVEFISLKCPRS